MAWVFVFELAVNQACRMLHLPTIRAQFPDLADAAAREQMTYRRSERQIKAAGFPRQKSARAFDFDANPSVDPAVIHIPAAPSPSTRSSRPPTPGGMAFPPGASVSQGRTTPGSAVSSTIQACG